MHSQRRLVFTAAMLMIIWIISADWLSDMKSWQFSVCHDKDCLASMCTLLELNIQVKAWAQSWLNIFIGLIGLKPCLRVFFRWTMCKDLASGKQCLWPLLRATAVPINKAVSARQQPGGNEQLCSTTSFPKSAKNNLCPVQRKTDRERELESFVYFDSCVQENWKYLLMDPDVYKSSLQ